MLIKWWINDVDDDVFFYTNFGGEEEVWRAEFISIINKF